MPSPPSPSVTAPCASCHVEIAAEWRASYHARAFTDATFRASLGLERDADRAFCVRCHAPAPDANDGVHCEACHGAQPHERDLARGPAACASCHEFTFEGRAELVQKTVTEHAASSFAGVRCADCHMPARAGHHDHTFEAGHAPASLARAVRVEAAKASEASVRFSIRVDAGHAFPTGDMFRRARLLVFAEAEDGRVVASAERVFGREWGSERGGARVERADTRIRERWSEDVALEEPSAKVARVRWRLLYERVVSVRPPHVAIASSDAIAEGVVPF